MATERVKALFSSFIHTPQPAKSDEITKGLCLESSSENSIANDCQKVSPANSLTQPLDREAYYNRLNTYTPVTWFAKPDWLAPPVCACYGWQNVSLDTLRCVSCRAFLAGKMPTSADPQVYAECCERMYKALKSAHNPHCAWSSNPSPETFLTLPVTTKEEALSMTSEKFSNLLEFENKLPFIQKETLTAMEISSGDLDSVVAMLMSGSTSPGVNDDIQSAEVDSTVTDLDVDTVRGETAAAVLAICGWNKVAGCSTAQVSCEFCKRTVGLWNYHSPVTRHEDELERIELERIEQERLEKERIEKERLEKERLERERLEQEKLEKERLEREKIEQERLEQERLEKERLEKERLEEERLEKERLEGERLENERLEQERLKEERLEQERLEKERLEQERLENERLQNEKFDSEKQEEKISEEKLENEEIIKKEKSGEQSSEDEQMEECMPEEIIEGENSEKEVNDELIQSETENEKQNNLVKQISESHDLPEDITEGENSKNEENVSVIDELVRAESDKEKQNHSLQQISESRELPEDISKLENQIETDKIQNTEERTFKQTASGSEKDDSEGIHPDAKSIQMESISEEECSNTDPHKIDEKGKPDVGNLSGIASDQNDSSEEHLAKDYITDRNKKEDADEESSHNSDGNVSDVESDISKDESPQCSHTEEFHPVAPDNVSHTSVDTGQSASEQHDIESVSTYDRLEITNIVSEILDKVSSDVTEPNQIDVATDNGGGIEKDDMEHINLVYEASSDEDMISPQAEQQFDDSDQEPNSEYSRDSYKSEAENPNEIHEPISQEAEDSDDDCIQIIDSSSEGEAQPCEPESEGSSHPESEGEAQLDEPESEGSSLPESEEECESDGDLASNEDSDPEELGEDEVHEKRNLAEGEDSLPFDDGDEYEDMEDDNSPENINEEEEDDINEAIDEDECSDEMATDDNPEYENEYESLHGSESAVINAGDEWAVEILDSDSETSNESEGRDDREPAMDTMETDDIEEPRTVDSDVWRDPDSGNRPVNLAEISTESDRDLTSVDIDDPTEPVTFTSEEMHEGIPLEGSDSEDFLPVIASEQGSLTSPFNEELTQATENHLDDDVSDTELNNLDGQVDKKPSNPECTSDDKMDDLEENEGILKRKHSDGCPDGSSAEDESPTPNKKVKYKSSRTYYHPLAEHRSWCPYVFTGPTEPTFHTSISDQPAIQLDDAKTPGWRRLLELLLFTKSPEKCKLVHMAKTTPPHASLRSIRHMLQEWTSSMTDT